MRFKPVGKIRSAEAGPSERAFELERVIGPSFRAAYCGSPVVCKHVFIHYLQGGEKWRAFIVTG